MKIISALIIAIALSVGVAHAENDGDIAKFGIGDKVRHTLDHRIGFVTQIHIQTNTVSHTIGEPYNKETFFLYEVRFPRFSYDNGVTTLYPYSTLRDFELERVGK